jgi:hypothetical protein
MGSVNSAAPTMSGHGAWQCLPTGLVVALIGALALAAAYFMPWFGVRVGNQGVVLSGEFLGRFLAGNADLRQFLPGVTDPTEGQRLRLLVYFFPAAGALAAVLALLGMGRASLGRWLDLLLALCGLLPLIALLASLSRLPPGASPEKGLWLMGLGAIAILLGAGLDLRRPRSSGGELSPESRVPSPE